MFKKSFKILTVFFIPALIFYFVLSLPVVQRKILYPFPYRSTVEEYSERYQVDRFLAIAVIKTESNFYEAARSHTGAIGLMQIMPETAYWIAYKLDEDPPTISELHESDRNIKYGIWYLSELEDEFFGNDVLALAAYNAGRGNVHHWIEENGWTQNFSDIEKIPYEETRHYVKRVLHCREKYSELYGSSEGETKFIEPHELRLVSLKNIKN